MQRRKMKKNISALEAKTVESVKKNAELIGDVKQFPLRELKWFYNFF